MTVVVVVVVVEEEEEEEEKEGKGREGKSLHTQAMTNPSTTNRCSI
jgi:hypothetical protein